MTRLVTDQVIDPDHLPPANQLELIGATERECRLVRMCAHCMYRFRLFKAQQKAVGNRGVPAEIRNASGLLDRFGVDLARQTTLLSIAFQLLEERLSVEAPELLRVLHRNRARRSRPFTAPIGRRSA